MSSYFPKRRSRGYGGAQVPWLRNQTSQGYGIRQIVSRKRKSRAYSSAPSRSIVKYNGRGGSGEVKYLDPTPTGLVPAGWNSFSPCAKSSGSGDYAYGPLAFNISSVIASGTNVNQRVGNHLYLEEMRLNYVTCAAPNGNRSELVRIMVIVDDWPNKTTMGTNADTNQARVTNATALCTLLLKDYALMTVTDGYQIMIAQAVPENYYRFKIKYDQIHQVSASAADIAAVPHSIVIPLGINAIYTDNSTSFDGSNQTKGSVWVLMIGSQDASASNQYQYAPKVLPRIRITFKD